LLEFGSDRTSAQNALRQCFPGADLIEAGRELEDVVSKVNRVVKKDGSISGYRWGVKRKRELLAREQRSNKFGLIQVRRVTVSAFWRAGPRP
jgi:hypothetical protein